MARIIYKEGCEGQNTLESIEGIEIELLNGRKALIYPKYAELPLLTDDKIEEYKARSLAEFKEQQEGADDYATRLLLYHNSPAAKYIAKIHSDKYGVFTLPTLLAVTSIQDQKQDIDRLAETIEGADLLKDFTSNIWSYCYFNNNLGWVAGVGICFLISEFMKNTNLIVPVILY